MNLKKVALPKPERVCVVSFFRNFDLNFFSFNHRTTNFNPDKQ